jgi:hypothetical protein
MAVKQKGGALGYKGSDMSRLEVFDWKCAN